MKHCFFIVAVIVVVVFVFVVVVVHVVFWRGGPIFEALLIF